MPSILNATTTNGLVTSADNSGELQLQTNNGTTAVTVTTGQNVGIGTASPTARLEPFYTSTAPSLTSSSGAGLSVRGNSTVRLNVGSYPTSPFAAWIQASDNANSSYDIVVNPLGGNLLVGTTTSRGIGTFFASSGNVMGVEHTGSGTVTAIQFRQGSPSVVCGSITMSNASSTAYNTNSDYRLKENIAPMAGALNKVASLKPVTYTWKSDGSESQGFIAHELQAVVPDCVTGEKDAVDENGNPIYQGVDTSFLVATLTAAIQELKAELDATKAEVQALKGVA